MAFAVVAVKADGTESFFSNTALNNDRDHDGISDADELLYGTDPNNPDTDGDGIPDGEEILRGTNPVQNGRRAKNTSAIILLLLND